ncbi:NEDD4 family-interacting protein 1 [Lamellibrachia satsuma]|nr:NEDD4 family-interacting protein 1 [Lamellibrachia satsuma]
MSGRTRYEALQTEDMDDRPATPTPDPVTIATQEAEQTAIGVDMAAEVPKQDTTNVAMPPPYDIATKLPTYEEAEILKIEQDQQDQLEPENFTYLGMKLGTDGIFLCTFIISFLFNWMGLLATLCLSETVAGRLGAIAGFGLSIVKWAAILKQHNSWGHGLAQADSWIWWLLIVLGFMIFIRGCLHYIGLKYQWYQMREGVRQRAYLIF